MDSRISARALSHALRGWRTREPAYEALADGTGAARQRAAFARSGRLEDVVDLIVAETARGTG